MSLATSPVAMMLPVTDPGRSQEFYAERLGLPFKGKDAEGNPVFELNGATLVLLQREAGTQNPSTAMSWEVEDVSAEVAELERRGVAFEDYDLPNIRTVDHIAAMGGGQRSAWFKDPDGNVLCVHDKGGAA